MRRLIREVGPLALAPKVGRSPFESLARAIAYQQLHDKAAESILRKFIALFPGRRFPGPDEVLALRSRAIRRAGFSRSKIVALRERHPAVSWDELSMGMTEDYPLAIEEGATSVRVGRAIFGERP